MTRALQTLTISRIAGRILDRSLIFGKFNDHNGENFGENDGSRKMAKNNLFFYRNFRFSTDLLHKFVCRNLLNRSCNKQAKIWIVFNLIARGNKNFYIFGYEFVHVVHFSLASYETNIEMKFCFVISRISWIKKENVSIYTFAFE